jgi:hypothetical protein
MWRKYVHPSHSRCQGVCKSPLSVHTKQGSQSFLQFACLLTIAVRQSIFRGQVRSCTNILCLSVAFYCVSNRYALLPNTGLSGTPPAGHMWLAELYNVAHSYFEIYKALLPPCGKQLQIFLRNVVNIFPCQISARSCVCMYVCT